MRQRARAGHDEVGGAVLVAERVAADDDRLRPARHEPRHVGDHDRLAEDDATEDVADRPVGRAVHLLEPELLDARLVGCDRRALHADPVLLDRVRGVDRDLVVGRVAALDAEVEVLQVDVEVRQDQLVLDELPDDPGHLVAVEFDDGISHLDLRHSRQAIFGEAMTAHDDVPHAHPPPTKSSNQAPPLQGRNLFEDNLPLVEALEREGGGWARAARRRRRRVLGRRAAGVGPAGQREPAEAAHPRPPRPPHRRGRVPPGVAPADGGRASPTRCTACRGPATSPAPMSRGRRSTCRACRPRRASAAR